MSDMWKPHDDQRRAILMIEAAALLHDIGKLSNGFLGRVAKKDPSKPSVSYDYSLRVDPNTLLTKVEIGTDEASQALKDLRELANKGHRGKPYEDLKNADVVITRLLDAHVFKAWDNQEYTLALVLLLSEQKYIDKDWQPLTGLSMEPAKLIGALHGVAHFEKETTWGGAKESDDKFLVRTLQQSYGDVFWSTPFGWESLIVLDAPDEDLTSELVNLPWHRINEMFTGQRLTWLHDVRKRMRKGVADNQRPTNEVTLWDWGYTVAAFAKAAAYRLFQTNSRFDKEALAFRSLAVSFDRLQQYERADRISDLLGVRRELNDAYDGVRRILEEEYACANLFYHDETGAYYLFPDVGDEIPEDLRRRISEEFPPDLRPLIFLGDAVTAGPMDPGKNADVSAAVGSLVADPREKALELQASLASGADVAHWIAVWSEHRPENAEICTVCGVRPVGYPAGVAGAEQATEPWATQQKAVTRNICRICLERRGRQSATWANGDLSGTIWTDEVADNNGRLALFVGKLDLDGWLDGRLLKTLLVQIEKKMLIRWST